MSMAANKSHDFLRDWAADSHALGAVFRERAGKHDLEGTFVASNYRDLKAASLFSASVPTELGGAGRLGGDEEEEEGEGGGQPEEGEPARVMVHEGKVEGCLLAKVVAQVVERRTAENARRAFKLSLIHI